MTGPHRIAVLALEGSVGFDLGVPAQVFGAARDEHGEPLYEVRVCTPDGGPIRCAAGYRVHPEHGPEALDWAQTVITIGMQQGSPVKDGVLDQHVIDALRTAAGHARMMSICTGAFVLAAAGLLDGRPATTHWSYARRFRRLFPRVLLDPDVLFVDDGDVLTSAGVGAGPDLCLHVIRRDHGSGVANRAARRCVIAPWRDGGQSQFIERPLPATTEAGTTATREWALHRLGEPLTLRELAEHARMSVRTFTRRFREETGMSPGQWLVHQRVEHVRRLLEDTDLPVDQIATRAGFGTAASLRQHLRARLGVAPSAYRRTFRPAG